MVSGYIEKWREKMNFEFVKNRIAADFILEKSAFSGVVKIAGKVCEDVQKVTGITPIVKNRIDGTTKAVIVGTLSKSVLLEALEKEGKVDFSNIRGKWETFSFQIVNQPYEGVEQALVIAGSDKRGTIYGLFHISELMHVSPWVDFSDVEPAKCVDVCFSSRDCMISKEPSVKYRGFFINDEWPAFGNWTFEHFDGYTVKMYELIFETLLRLKGNYLWPAMWTSSFSLDGPGEENAILADEYGIVMSNSHHEPCLRHSEEWDMVRGKESEYGNDWNYDKNKEGLIKYWRDGLKRSGKYDNIITIGMRGERDSSMLGTDATLKQNIDLLKDIITEQRKLIAEHIELDGHKAPQMLALYKEVEDYFYGDENAEGLCKWDGLDRVTFMLCEDNFGNMRTLPTKELCNRDGGWGMYYHFDYHGGPISYEWVNSSYLPKVWDQMTKAYEFGIQDIWIVNVGDLKFQEYPLSFFMDLAYDYETWGSSNLNAPNMYLSQWVEREFGSYLDDETKETLTKIMIGYTKLNHNRKPEAMRPDIYHPVHFDEAESTLNSVLSMEEMLEAVKEKIPACMMPAYWELVYYPAAGSLNVQKMNLYAGLNHYFANMRAIVANDFADKVAKCIEHDRQLTKEFHGILDGKWNGMALSEHIGFINWNDEECQYPLKMYVDSTNKPRLYGYSKGEEVYTAGGDWTGKKIYMKQFLHPEVNEGILVLQNASVIPVDYSIQCDCTGIVFSKTSGTVTKTENIKVMVDKSQLQKESGFVVHYQGGNIRVVIKYDYEVLTVYPPMTFLVADGYIAIEAEHFAEKWDTCNGAFQIIEGYGRTISGLKTMPCDVAYEIEDAPYLEYHIWIKEDCDCRIYVYSAPTNPLKNGENVEYGIQINETERKKIKLIADRYQAGEPGCTAWAQMVLNQIHITEEKIYCRRGMNTIRIFALTPGFVLEKIVVTEGGKKVPDSYLGPKETYYYK